MTFVFIRLCLYFDSYSTHDVTRVSAGIWSSGCFKMAAKGINSDQVSAEKPIFVWQNKCCALICLFMHSKCLWDYSINLIGVHDVLELGGCVGDATSTKPIQTSLVFARGHAHVFDVLLCCVRSDVGKNVIFIWQNIRKWHSALINIR